MGQTFWIVLLLFYACFSVVNAQIKTPLGSPKKLVNSELYKHREVLDAKGNYLLSWEINWKQERVTFNVTVKTKGYVGFGLSRKGKMSGADIVIGGVDNNGRSYFSDRYAKGYHLPEIDHSQDWTLHSSWERGKYTFLSFSRAFKTGDDAHDLPIGDDSITIIWSYGEKDDDFEYHFENRGSYQIYLLDPNLSKQLGNKATNEIHSIERKFTMPAKETTYWCTYHKSPTSSKRHIIGFNPIFPTEADRQHIHHFLLFRCLVPRGQTAEGLFDKLTQDEGEECYFQVEPETIGAKYCREVMYIFAIGGKPVVFPPHVGVPMSEEGTEYYVLQIHYDNQQKVSNLEISSRLELHYTEELRQHDAGIWWVGTPPPAATNIFLPPNTMSHVIVGHCAPGCTQSIFPSEGINVFAALTHTHTTGAGMRVLHFRGNRELPWLIHDDNYNFNYQQWRMLREERRVLPGDQLAIRCTYDTTARNGTVVVGGYSTQEEMCDMPLYYYNRISMFSNCRGQIREESYFNFLGVHNFTWNREVKQLEISQPEEFAGVTLAEYGTNHVNWNIAKRRRLQWHHLNQQHVTTCSSNDPDVEFDADRDEHSATLPRGKYRK